MGNVSVVIDNLVDAAVVSADTWVIDAPPELIQTPHIGERWKSLPGSSAYLLLDLGSLQSIDTVCFFGVSRPDDDLPLMNISIDDTAITRVRISSVDASGATGDLYDASATGEAFEGIVARCLDAPVSGQYVRIDISQSGAAAILCGGACIGLRDEFLVNPVMGYASQVTDLSKRARSDSGRTFTKQKSYYRSVDMNFQWVEEEQRWDLLDQLDTVIGTHSNLLIIRDWESDYLAREVVFGLVSDVSPVIQAYFDLVSKTLRVDGRL